MPHEGQHLSTDKFWQYCLFLSVGVTWRGRELTGVYYAFDCGTKNSLEGWPEGRSLQREGRAYKKWLTERWGVRKGEGEPEGTGAYIERGLREGGEKKLHQPLTADATTREIVCIIQPIF